MSPTDELVLMAIRGGYNTIIAIAKKIKRSRTDVSTYCRRLEHINLIKFSTCKTCHQTKTYIPV